MRKTIPVILSLFLSLLVLGGSQPAQPGLRNSTSPLEPAGPLSAEASLVSLGETPHGRMALLRIDLVAHDKDAEVMVTPVEDDRATPRGPAVGHLRLAAEQRGFLIVEAAAPSGRETHLFYRVRGRSGDGSVSELDLHYRVPPDDTGGCQTVGDYIQCEGEPVDEVQP